MFVKFNVLTTLSWQVNYHINLWPLIIAASISYGNSFFRTLISHLSSSHLMFSKRAAVSVADERRSQNSDVQLRSVTFRHNGSKLTSPAYEIVKQMYVRTYWQARASSCSSSSDGRAVDWSVRVRAVCGRCRLRSVACQSMSSIIDDHHDGLVRSPPKLTWAH